MANIITPQLIQDCLKDSQKAQHSLYKACFSLLIGMCRRYANSNDDAVFLMNTGFIKVINNLKSYNTNIPFEAWAKRIMRNTIIDEFRYRNREKRQMEVLWNEAEQIEEYVAWNRPDDQLNAEYLYACLDRLPETHKLVFNLFAIDGYSHKEIGEILNLSEGTSKWYVNNARQRLKEMILILQKTPEKKTL